MRTKVLSFEEIDPFIRFPHPFDLPAGSSLPPRAAYDYRLMYIYGGKGSIVIDGSPYEAVKGNLFVWRPGVVYRIIAAPGEDLTILGVNFDFTQTSNSIGYPIPPENEDRFNPDNITEIIDFSDLEGMNGIIFLRGMQTHERLLLDMANEHTIRKRFFTHKIRGSFLLLLGDVARHVTSTYTEQDETGHKVDLILKHIREHYDKPLTNKEIGEHFNFHPVYINRLLVKYTGTSLHQYLINYRISLAVNLLQNSGKTITEIAYETGFKDVNYFSKCFKKTVGLSPKHYVSAARHSWLP
jgi:AraC-like DNA-binding protein